MTDTALSTGRDDGRSTQAALARLRALRLVGFKSFAERTVLEFGPGISAIVGPNGSGKSNLADALRWALGEQGRSLRTRKSEDVIFAGSARRQATGMADVTLVIDNSDELLPVDFTEVDVARRLFRSGENEYLVNRQRVRLRDLVELLDGANLADNAFLFIGQGMVDQALSLRPEERRPLFEEVAGVRRHERRRRHAEDQLVEAEANLARVRDILAELRPQARRLAAQAQQQEARRETARELARAIAASGRAKLSTTARELQDASTQLAKRRAELEEVLASLRAREERAAALNAEIEAHTERERAARSELETLRARLTELRLSEARAHAELGSTRRQLERLRGEREAVDRRTADARAAAAVPLPELDAAAQSALESMEAELQEARSNRDTAARFAEARAHLDLLRSQAAEREHAIASHRAQRSEADARRERARQYAEQHGRALQSAVDRVGRAEDAEEQLRAEIRAEEVRRDALADELTRRAQDISRLRARLSGLDEAIRTASSPELASAARAHGGEALLEGVDVDPGMREAIEAALGAAVTGIAVPERAVMHLRALAGTLVIDGDSRSADDEDRAAFLARVAQAGGVALDNAVRSDSRGRIARILRSAAWVPSLEAALALRHEAPAGWRLVTASGEVVTSDGVVELRRGSGAIERRDERNRAADALTRADTAHRDARAALQEATTSLARLQQRARDGRAVLTELDTARREAEEQARLTARDLDRAERESSWEAVQLERDEAALEQLREQLRALESTVAEQSQTSADEAAARVADLERRRGRLAAHLQVVADRRREAEDSRQRAQVALDIDRARTEEISREMQALEAAERRLETDVGALATQVAAARDSEQRSHDGIQSLESVEAEARGRFAALEREIAATRERSRRADELLRTAEHIEIESRMHVETVREQMLVELAGLGGAALEALGVEAPPGPPAVATADRPEAAAVPNTVDVETDAEADGIAHELSRALDRAVAQWAAEGEPEPADVPGPGRIATLRRRYNELGASNPYAVEEYAEVQARLETLERERADLESAITSTRKLIAELTTLMGDKFRTTFQRLEVAFARQFEQLFGGGDARLELTEPEDLSTTGIEILARPPGKKRQALAMLSGGERALTAVALLFAMLEVRPVPFCVLDEVDAALDEANISRFLDQLRKLAKRIQFIVITHNRGTIEAADALYGVTIGDDAVSRVISMRLSEPIALPERDEARARHGTAEPVTSRA